MVQGETVRDCLNFNCTYCLSCNSNMKLLFSVPGPQGTPTDGGFTMMMVMVGWLVIATALFMLRPSRLRGNGDQKPAGGGGGDNVSQTQIMLLHVQECLPA